QTLSGWNKLLSDKFSALVDPRLLLSKLTAKEKSLDSVPHGCTCKWNTKVTCRSLNLTEIPKHISRETTSLYLAVNEIEHINHERLAMFDRLRVLSLQDNRLSNLTYNAFTSLDGLRKLYLGNNRINTIHIAAFRDLENLEWISLAGNPLETLSVDIFTDVIELINLDLTGIEIANIDERMFRHLHKLHHIFVKYQAYCCHVPHFYYCHVDGEDTPLNKEQVNTLCSNANDY
uniref:Relaxin receptor 1-like n=1 Tax=Saccoglossus kowalevskii TaxID=10224 RepID=A0ABM0MT02_SACKO